MNRTAILRDLESQIWDIVIVGGGATGTGAAVDAALRGYRTLLVEQRDFGQATSSRSTKLVHGGVRYLQQGKVRLVIDALRERGRLLRNANHLVHWRTFVIPCYSAGEWIYYGSGLKAYDLLALNLQRRSHWLSRAETLHQLPTLRRSIAFSPTGNRQLYGGVQYEDGQFDDARLAWTLARTALGLGAHVLNYCRVVALLHAAGKVSGVRVRDEETEATFDVRARVVINATGIFVNDVQRMDEPASPDPLAYSRGTHLVLDAHLLPTPTALMIPRTDDGRVLFAIPWQQRVLLGTTDVATNAAELEPRASPEEVDFLLRHFRQYIATGEHIEVRSVFAGIRPLYRGASRAQATSTLSRDHAIFVSRAGLVSITGGKWTTYRRMGEDVINRAAKIGQLRRAPCRTRDLLLHGAAELDSDQQPRQGNESSYGTDWINVQQLMQTEPALATPLHERLPYNEADVVWATRNEMARTVEDVLARRTRALLLDAQAACQAAPRVAQLMANQLDRDAHWCREQVAAFTALAANYQ